MTECPFCGAGIRSDTLVCPSCLRDLAVPDFVLNTASESGVTGETADLLRKVFHSTTEGMIVTDAYANIVLVNEAFSMVTGYRPDELLGQNPRLLKSGRQSDSFYVELWEGLKQSGFEPRGICAG